VTSAQTRLAIQAEMARGDEGLDEASLLLDGGKFAGSVSRAYYGAFHYARAMLLASGEEPRTHGGITRLIQRNYVVTGRMTPETAALLSRLQTFRQEADYTAEFVISPDMARVELEGARAFVEAARAVLIADGWREAAPR
jgi:uncharacterized protein (UPF0332 family)